MELLLKLTALCVLAASVSAMLKKNEPQWGLLLSLTVLLCSAALLLPSIRALADFARVLADRAGLGNEVFGMLLQLMLVGAVTRLASAFCNDAAQSALSALLELTGGICALTCMLPLLRTVAELLEAWL